MEAATRTLHAGELEIRPGERAALAGGKPLPLTLREVRLLIELASMAERIVPREELYERVWGEPMRAGDRSIDVYVSKLRRKLCSALPGWRFIHTHSGFGYRFSPEPEG